MEPFSVSNEKRLVRAYEIYPKTLFFNHDWLPNACRFDYVDAASDGNTDIVIKMIHVPEGREVCLSYFPVNMSYSSRQKRLLEDYGFKVNVIGVKWNLVGRKGRMMRTRCEKENCFGTLAPLPPKTHDASRFLNVMFVEALRRMKLA
ncbi:unnamed protein product [Arabis nemorensis]|uniref:Uncharacterized protein n=1 Tax=Arabis nemorensis TaxID=586526 RepID=A0A565CAX7_9BRAS|nr:unnamed protein product [Arabis nemorensis]